MAAMLRHAPSVLVAVVVAASLIVLPPDRAAAQPPAPGSEVVSPLPLPLPLPPNNPQPPVATPPAVAPALVSIDAGAVPLAPEAAFYKRPWFWAALAVIGVTAAVILVASSGPDQPATTLGNMRAF